MEAEINISVNGTEATGHANNGLTNFRLENVSLEDCPPS